MELGDKIRDSGGLLQFQIASDYRISDVFVMKASIKQYAIQYSDVIICESCNKYGFTTTVNTLIDSLGLSVIQSYSQFCSEHSDHILKALRLFLLYGADETTITDDAPAYHIVANMLKKIHLMWKHYHNGITSAKSGLGHLAHDFAKDMFDAIYKDLKSVDALKQHFDKCLAAYSHASAATKFMHSLIADQEMVSFTHSKKVFSAYCKASQRCEGSNSRVNRNGTKKSEMRDWNLLQLLE